MLVAVSAIPHHHHDGMFCMIMEHCEKDGNINDEHTHHHDDHQVPDHSCIAKMYYLVTRTNNHVKCNNAFCNSLTHNHIFFSLLYLVPDCLRLNLDPSKIKPDNSEHIIYYKPAIASQSHGLRAPPFVG